MYETQSGRDLDSAAIARARNPDSTVRRAGAATGGRGGGFGGGAGAVPTGRGGGQDREWYRGIQVGFDDVATFTRRANTNYMQTGVHLGAAAGVDVPGHGARELLHQDAQLDRGTAAPRRRTRFVIPVQRDMTKVAELVKILRVQRVEVGHRDATRSRSVTTTYPAGSYVIKLDQPYGRLAKNLLERQDYPDARAAHLRRQRLVDGLRDGCGRGRGGRLLDPQGATSRRSPR